MSLILKQIFMQKPNNRKEYVTYENQLQPRIVFQTEELAGIFQKHEKDILTLVEKEITEYVNDDFLCNDEEDMFPKRSRLTGEWYIRDIGFYDKDYLSICTSFLEIFQGTKMDYLGLEVHLVYDEKIDKFLCDGIDSESI